MDPDFTKSFPNFIISEIFSYLHKENLRDLRYLSKQWNVHLTPLVMQKLKYQGSCDLFILQKMCSFSGRFITSLHFTSVNEVPIDKKATLMLADYCKNIRALIISVGTDWQAKAEFIRELGGSQRNLEHLTLLLEQASSEFLVSISDILRKLDSFDMREFGIFKEAISKKLESIDCPELRILTFYSDAVNDAKAIGAIRAKFPKLKLLNLYRKLESSGSRSLCLRVNPSSLRSFCLYDYDVDYLELKPQSTNVCFENQLELFSKFSDRSISLLEFIQKSSKVKKIKANLVYGHNSKVSKEILALLTAATDLDIWLWSDKCLTMKSEYLNIKSFELYIKEPCTGLVLEWIASCFPALKKLSLRFAIKAGYMKIGVLKFPTLVKLYTNSPQTLKFWTFFISSSPKIKFIYPSSSDKNCGLLRAKFETVQVIPVGYMPDFLDRPDLTGADNNSKHVIRLAK